MALFSGADYRSGAQGYVYSKAQTGRLVASNATSDPSVQTGVSELLGFADNPSAQRNEGMEPVTVPGSMRVVTHTRGQRTHQLNVRMLVGDGSFLTYAARDHADPDKAGTVMGLPLRTYEYGVSQDYGTSQSDAEQALDALINSLNIEIREGQPLQASADIWPAVILDDTDGVTAKATGSVMSDPVLHWVHLDWEVGGTDYHPILSGTTISLNNTLQRVGVRKQIGAAGSEEKISRTPYYIKPGPEMLGLRHDWKDKLPSSLRNTDDWSTLTARAEEPGEGPGRRYVQIAIAHNYLQRWSRQASNARSMMTWNGENLSYELSITEGTT